MRAFLRFATLSGLGWLLDCALLLFFAWLGVRLGLANALSSVVAALTVFFASRLWVFGSVAIPMLSRAALYLYYQAFSIFAASVLIGPAVGLGKWLAAMAGVTLVPSAAAFLGKIIITPPQFIANFLISRYLIVDFRRTRPNA